MPIVRQTATRSLPGLCLLAALLWVPAAPADAPALQTPNLSADSDVSTAGFYQLTWEGMHPAASFELQEARRADFADARVFYRGPDLATVMSGKPDGDYYYRLRAIGDGSPTTWSDTVHVEVRHHPLGRALTFLTLGAIVFIATTVLILRGEARTRS